MRVTMYQAASMAAILGLVNFTEGISIQENNYGQVAEDLSPKVMNVGQTDAEFEASSAAIGGVIGMAIAGAGAGVMSMKNKQALAEKDKELEAKNKDVENKDKKIAEEEVTKEEMAKEITDTKTMLDTEDKELAAAKDDAAKLESALETEHQEHQEDLAEKPPKDGDEMDHQGPKDGQNDDDSQPQVGRNDNASQVTTDRQGRTLNAAQALPRMLNQNRPRFTNVAQNRPAASPVGRRTMGAAQNNGQRTIGVTQSRAQSQAQSQIRRPSMLASAGVPRYNRNVAF